MKNNEPNATAGNPSPAKKKFHIRSSHVIMGLAAFAYFFVLQTDQALAADMWSKAEDIILLMNFSKSGKTVDESRAWLKRIVISWVILNGLGFILAYVTPFFADGKWTG